MVEIQSKASQATGIFQTEYGHFIDGEWVGSLGANAPIPQIYPATTETLGSVADGCEQDVDRAVKAAGKAFTSWSKSSPAERQELLLAIAARLSENANELGKMETLNTGIPIGETVGFHMPLAIELFRYYASMADTLEGKAYHFPDTIAYTSREPIGVCAQIIPWNAPIFMFAAKVAPALAAGCTIVLKPSELASLAVLEAVKLISNLLPKGVVNIINGRGSTVGKWLVSHPGVRKVVFTGSTTTGREIIRNSAVNIIPQTLELGGKSAQIVCSNADIDAAVEGALMSNILGKGEMCTSGSRVFLHEAVRDEYMEKLTNAISTIRIGDPLSPSTHLGAQASEAQFKRILGYLDLAKSEGATFVTGGEAANVAGFERGYFIQPTIVENVRNEMRIAQEEIFGPVTCVISWTDEEEVIRQVNDSIYGLAGGVWSQDIGQAHRLARGVDSGVVYVNRWYNLKVGTPIGGVKQSGFGREYGRAALDAYTIEKSVLINLNDGKMGLFES